MKKDKAAKALSIALKIAKPNSATPFIELTGDYLVANNGEVAIELEFPVDLDFPVVCHATMLKNSISGIRDKELSFEYKNDALYINGKVRVPLTDKEGAIARPLHAGLKKESGYVRLSDKFSQHYKETTPHRNTDKLRPAMMCAYLAPDGGLWATNTYTVVMIEGVGAAHDTDMLNRETLPVTEQGVLIPTLPCDFLHDATLEAYIADYEEMDCGKNVTRYHRVYVIEDAEKRFYFKRMNRHDHKYPQIPSVVPLRESIPTFISLKADELIDALKESLAAVGKCPTGVFTPTIQSLQFECADIYLATEYVSSVPASIVSSDEFTDERSFGINRGLMLNCLQSFKGQTIEIGYSQPNRAIRFFSEARPELTCLCMPVMLSN